MSSPAFVAVLVYHCHVLHFPPCDLVHPSRVLHGQVPGCWWSVIVRSRIFSRLLLKPTIHEYLIIIMVFNLVQSLFVYAVRLQLGQRVNKMSSMSLDAILHSLLQHSLLQHSLLQHSLLQHSLLQHSLLQHSLLQHSLLQHSLLQLHLMWLRNNSPQQKSNLTSSLCFVYMYTVYVCTVIICACVS